MDPELPAAKNFGLWLQDSWPILTFRFPSTRQTGSPPSAVASPCSRFGRIALAVVAIQKKQLVFHLSRERRRKRGETVLRPRGKHLQPLSGLLRAALTESDVDKTGICQNLSAKWRFVIRVSAPQV